MLTRLGWKGLDEIKILKTQKLITLGPGVNVKTTFCGDLQLL
jgi:hypothetical protein